jgi:hypothetical protein
MQVDSGCLPFAILLTELPDEGTLGGLADRGIARMNDNFQIQEGITEIVAGASGVVSGGNGADGAAKLALSPASVRVREALE